ncbi:hypothetical protein RJ639_013033, partial [Escallonia herrerae]
ICDGLALRSIKFSRANGRHDAKVSNVGHESDQVDEMRWIQQQQQQQQQYHDRLNIRVRAADMPLALQNRAFRCTRDTLDSMPGKLDSKRLALALKKKLEIGGNLVLSSTYGTLDDNGLLSLSQEFDVLYGPAWHCIVGTSFGSYVTHSLGGFLYFSVDKVYVLLFKTAVEPLEH